MEKNRLEAFSDGVLAIIITGAAVVASERRAGTIVLVLTKPLSRGGFTGLFFPLRFQP